MPSLQFLEVLPRDGGNQYFHRGLEGRKQLGCSPIIYDRLGGASYRQDASTSYHVCPNVESNVVPSARQNVCGEASLHGDPRGPGDSRGEWWKGDPPQPSLEDATREGGWKKGQGRDEIVSWLLERAVELVGASVADSTKGGYKRAFAFFERFCNWLGFQALPASQETIFVFVAWMEVQGLGRRVPHHLSAISWMLRKKGLYDATQDSRVQMAVKATKRVGATEKMEVRGPFPLEALRAWEENKRRRASVRDLRDPALVAVGIRCMRRPGELCELKVRHVREYDKGLKIFLAKSKTDQTMEGRWMHVDAVPGSPICPVYLLQRYLKSRGSLHPDDPLFTGVRGQPMTSSGISSVVKNMCKVAGLEDKVSGHSLRIGGATLAVRGGLSMSEICAIGGWKSEAVLRYLRDCAVAERGGSALMGF